jgi:hypothetical protein
MPPLPAKAVSMPVEDGGNAGRRKSENLLLLLSSGLSPFKRLVTDCGWASFVGVFEAGAHPREGN